VNLSYIFAIVLGGATIVGINIFICAAIVKWMFRERIERVKR